MQQQLTVDRGNWGSMCDTVDFISSALTSSFSSSQSDSLQLVMLPE